MLFLELFVRWTQRRQAVTMGELLDEVARTRFDGALIIHFRKGQPMKVEAGRPLQVELLTQPESPSTMARM